MSERAEDPAPPPGLYGLRQWSLTPDGALVGVRGHRWGPGPQRARCRRVRADRVAHTMSGCTCGFYARHRDLDDQPLGAVRVTGVVRGWDEVVVGAEGWRARRAQVVALVDPGRLAPARPAWGLGTTWRGERWWALAHLLVAAAAVVAVVCDATWGRALTPVLALSSASYCALWVVGVLRPVPSARRLLAERFPGVALYPDLASAARAHALDAGPPPARPR